MCGSLAHGWVTYLTQEINLRKRPLWEINSLTLHGLLCLHLNLSEIIFNWQNKKYCKWLSGLHKRRMPLLSCSSLSDTQTFATVKFALHKSRRYDEGMIYHVHDERCSRPWCTESYVHNYWGSYKIFKGLLKIAQDLTLTIAARCLTDLAKIYATILQGLQPSWQDLWAKSLKDPWRSIRILVTIVHP